MRVGAVLAVLLLLLGEVVLSSPSLPVVYQRELTADVQVLTSTGNNYAACLSTGECLLINASSGEIVKRSNFLGMSFSQLLYSDGKLILVGSPISLAIVNASDLSHMASYNVLRQGELEVTRAALSSDGRYAALSIKHRVQGYTQDKLVVVDLAQGRRLFERDYSSADPLVYIFSLDSLGEFFLVEDINTSCHICQLTDNMVEVYRFGPSVQRVARKQTGLTRFKVIVGNNLLLQRVEDGTMLALSLPNLELTASTKFPAVRQAFSRGDQAYLVTENDELWSCSASLECRKLGTVPPRSLVAAVDSYLVVFSISRVLVYSLRSDGGLDPVLSYEIIWDFPPSPPSLVLSSDRSALAAYPGKKILGVYLASRAQLLVRVMSSDGKPLEGSVVTVTCSGGSETRLSSSGGLATFSVPPGKCTVRIAKEGFSEWSTVIDIGSFAVNVSAVLSKKEMPLSTLSVKVVDEVTGDPIAGAVLDIKGPVQVGARVNAQGVLTASFPPGNYTVEVTAPGYHPARVALSLSTNGSKIEVGLKPKLSSVSLLVSGERSATVTLAGTRYTVNGSLTLHLRPGVYALIVSPPCRANATSELILDGERNATVIIDCASVAAVSAESLRSLIGALEGATLAARRINLEVRGLGVRLLNGSSVDLVSLSYSKAVVVELFYTQCTGCRYLLPLLKQIANRVDVSVYSLTVSPLDDAKALTHYVNENGVTWPVGWAPSGIREWMNVTSYPTVLVLSEGRVVFVGVGARSELRSEFVDAVQAGSMFNNTVIALVSRALQVESYPVMLFTLGLVLVAVALAAGGKGGAEEQKESNLSADFASIPSFKSSLHSSTLETVAWPSQVNEESSEQDTW